MKKYTLETSVGIFVFVCLLCVGYLTVKLGKLDLLGGQNYTVQARFTSVSGLKAGSSVQMAGVPVGSVGDIHLDPKRLDAVVELQLRKDIRLTDDTIASIKTSGLIGDKYISLSPGGSDIYLEPGDMIIDTESALDIEALISKYAFGDVEDQGFEEIK